MKIEHIAIWVEDLEGMKTFYEEYFAVLAGEQYHNSPKHFTSYFLKFSSGCRIEIMNRPDIQSNSNPFESIGLAHFAISLGSKDRVDELTEKLRAAGFTIAGEPRTTGDGYYESVVLDPEGNRIELTI